jgi:hypothetical protein
MNTCSSQIYISNFRWGNEFALTFSSSCFLTRKDSKLAHVGIIILRFLSATFMKTHQNQYSNYNSDFGSPSPFPFMLHCIGDHTPFCNIFPKSLIITQLHHDGLGAKKEKTMLALNINARLKVLVYCNGNDSADFQFQKDMVKNTKHEQHHGE